MSLKRPEGDKDQAPEKPDTTTMENIVQASVEFTLKSLTDDELMAFHNLLGWGHKDLRKAAEQFSWFKKIQPLLTADGGTNIHPDTARAIIQAAIRRLDK